MVDALLVNQGLRRAAAGGHVVLQRSIAAQLDPPLGELVKDFGWMRQLRNAGDYPVPEKALANLLDAKEAAEVAKGLLDKIRQLVDQMPVY
ncbi:hypothetical protein [Glutamicibacter sp. NPDC087344]|uniref:hypothetical protein n=1 Tax=Glutamicibacter sp. NPDC087344 TaxID=3363994 RepID=UPI0037FACB16